MPKNESEVRGRLRSRKDSVSSGLLKTSKKGKAAGNDKKRKNDDKKDTSEDEDEDDINNAENDDEGKLKKIKKKCSDVISNEASFLIHNFNYFKFSKKFNSLLFFFSS